MTSMLCATSTHTIKATIRHRHVQRTGQTQLPQAILLGIARRPSIRSLQRRCAVFATAQSPIKTGFQAPSPTAAIAVSLLSIGVLPWPAAAAVFPVPTADLADGLETPVQLIYLLTLLGFLAVGAFLVVRQVLIRRELEEAAKVLGERVRAGEATAEDNFELGVILLRKKLFTQATKNLEKALKAWQGEEEELAQVHNALGYAYFNLDKVEASIAQYREAVRLQPGYVTAWNNLGDALEKLKRYGPALEAYSEALAFAPDNKVAKARADFCKTRLERTGGLSR
jgi:tetratricopeptide (TPR) repeat protein